MGYQESFRPIEHLAESAGIKKAIDDYEDNPYIPEYCHYCCTARERATGRLFAVVLGQRCRVHLVAGIDLDDCIPYEARYSDYYEDLEEKLVEAAAAERPDLVQKAYQEVSASFEEEAERGREWKRALREEANACWPHIAEVLKTFGPMPMRFFERLPLFEGHFMHNVLVDLNWQGLLTSDGNFCRDSICLTDKALELLKIEALPVPLREEELLVFLLEKCGPLSTTVLSGILGMSVSKVRGMLRKLIDEGKVIPEGRGRSRKYRLGTSEELVA